MQNQGRALDTGAGLANGHAVSGVIDGAIAIQAGNDDPGATSGPDSAAGRKPPRARASSPATAAAVQKQLLRAVQRQATMVDARLAGDGAEVEERDSRILGNLAKTLATLVEWGGQQRSGTTRNRPGRQPKTTG
jgi:hypothetical protein